MTSAVIFGTRAEDRTNGGKRFVEPHAKNQQHSEGNQRHGHADAQQDHQGQYCGHQAADEFNQAGADQIAHAFDVAHDAGNQNSGFVRIVKGNGQLADVGLHLAAQIGNHLLRGFGEQLREA